MKEVGRKAIRAYLTNEAVDPRDPTFQLFPLGASGKQGHHAGRDHDEELYGRER